MFRFFERLTNPFPEPDVTQPPTTLYKFCRYYAKGFLKPIILNVIMTAIVASAEIALFAFLGEIVDWLSHFDRKTFLQDTSAMKMLVGMSAVCLILLPIATFFSAWSRNQSFMGNLPMAVRWRMHNHLLNQSMKFYHEEFSGRVSAKMMQTALATRDIILKFTDIFVYIGVYIFSMLVLLSDLDLYLAVPMAVWCVVYGLVQFYYIPKLAKVSQEQAAARSDMTGRLVDAYTNITTVKLFAHTDREKDYAKASMEGFMDTVYRQFRFVTGVDVSVSICNYLLIFSSAAVGIYLWTLEMISVGALAVAVALAMRVSAMSHWLMFELASLFENIGTVTDGMQMMSRPIDVVDVAGAKELVVKKGKIDFDHVDFTYAADALSVAEEDDTKNDATVVLKGLGLHIAPGEKIGLVGRSGAGKSTLVSALLRFYNLQGGKICIDGQDISQVTQESLRQQIAMVTQDTSLLHRTIRDNILYGKPTATPQELQRAIENAQVAEFIDDLVDSHGNRGLDAEVGERGVKLSGGQRQRIAIARVLLKDAPILILDEATSALDSEVEGAIQENLLKLMQGKTVIAIAHRLSTIAQMDRLVVMEAGKIIEQGTHDQLIAQKGVYAQLWSRQTGGYLES